MPRTRRDVSEAQGCPELADRALVIVDAIPLADQTLEIKTSPAHHAVPLGIGTGRDDAGQLGHLLRHQAER
jgi:hypothetical protein